MTSFKFIETFLFLSLGITFALIVTLVYHFKKRMENMETKCDTMFEIVQKLANELSSIQNNTNNYPISDTNINSYDNLTEDIILSQDNLELSQERAHNTGVDDDSGSEDDDDSGSDDDDDEEDSGSDDDDDVSGSDDDDVPASINTPSTINFNKIDIPEDDKIKIINVSDSDILEVSSLNENNLEDLNYIDEDNDYAIEELNETDKIEVNKLDDIDDESVDHNKPSRSALKKLKIADLKDMAKQNNIDIDDNATKNTIIDLLLVQ